MKKVFINFIIRISQVKQTIWEEGIGKLLFLLINLSYLQRCNTSTSPVRSLYQNNPTLFNYQKTEEGEIKTLLACDNKHTG